MDDIYLCVDDDIYINIMWSSNDCYDPKSTGTIGIYVYDSDGNEHTEFEGGEMDVYDERTLEEYIPDVLDFIGLNADDSYVLLNEEDFPF